MTRRDFFRVMGASIALAGAGGCVEPPRERILPYTVQPPGITPGVPAYYATTMSLGGYGTGLLVESREGRPTKVEGNPDHPASLGAAGVYEQASVLQLYDPDRIRVPRRRTGVAGWEAFAREFGPTSAEQGRGWHLLIEPTASPLTMSLIGRILTLWPAAAVTFYSPLSGFPAMEGARLAMGRPHQPLYDLRRAAVIVALDSDFLDDGPFHLRYARDFADGRRLRNPADAMNRLYAAEASFTPTGTMADHRLPIRSSDIPVLAMALLAEIAPDLPAPVAPLIQRWRAQAGTDRFGNEGRLAGWIRAAARDLRAQPGRSLVVVGDAQPPVVHAIAHAINAMLGNNGVTVRFLDPLLPPEDPVRAIAALAAAIDAGAVEQLLILGGNPSYTAPADLQFGARIRKVAKTAYLGLYENETARDCEWLMPELHYLESWGDARAYDGTASFVQPLIRPLYDGRTLDEVLALFAGQESSGAHALLQDAWRTDPDFAERWARGLERGAIEGTAATPAAAAFRWDGLLPALAALPSTPADGIEVRFPRDRKVCDGRFANNAWLQELPDPVTKLTWDNAAEIAPATARRLGVETGDLVTITAQGRTLSVPVLSVPGHAEDTVTLPLGYGRAGKERVARGVGVNAYRLRTTAAPFVAQGAQVRRAERPAHRPTERQPREPTRRLSITQGHWRMEGRPIALEATLGEYRANPAFLEAQREEPLSLYEPVEYAGVQWAMTIDLSVCTGCSACVVACQAENNTPVVGREDVLKSREMHWLRIDRYYTGAEDDLRVISQPMLCQQCENAPCEYVCPVNATVHSPDGLNEMVYNRCVGTRFCSNNCPYKVRRFNWFDYNGGLPETLRMQRNPDVTVRERGVMEKCTYCVQRIRRAEIRAATEQRAMRDGEVVTACQQACPTRAIVFGSLGDPASAVSQTRNQPRSYAVLHELGTRPRTRYLARITNPSTDASV